jgi:hypothetical protein
VTFFQNETTIAATETQLFTVNPTLTAFTHTDEITTTLTVLATETTVETVTTTVTPDSTSLAPLKARLQTVTPTNLSTAIPDYASAVCPAWGKYVAACSCAVTPATVTAVGPVPTTITETVTSTTTVPVLSTLSTTEVDVVSVTATISGTETNVVSVTATTTVLKIDQITLTTTITETQTVTETAAAQPSCKDPATLGPFRASDNGPAGSVLHIYANMLNALSGGMTWNTLSTSGSASIQNKYIWALDSDGYLGLAYNIPPYTYKYSAYMSTASSGSNWPQLNTAQAVNAAVSNGGAVTKIRGCVNSLTGELTLDAAGRTNILFCGQQLWMSAGDGADVNRGAPCVKMTPMVSSA